MVRKRTLKKEVQENKEKLLKLVEKGKELEEMKRIKEEEEMWKGPQVFEALKASQSNMALKMKLANKVKGQGIKLEDLRDVPKGRGTFELCIIRGKTKPLSAFVDSGADKWFVRDDAIPELVASKIREGPIRVNVAGGLKAYASAEWGALLPLNDRTQQVVRGLALDKVAADCKSLDLRKLLEKIQSLYKDNEELQKLKVPAQLGSQIDMIIGQKYRGIHPETVMKLPSGIEIRRSRFLPWNDDEVGTISGPIAELERLMEDDVINNAIEDIRSMQPQLKTIKEEIKIEQIEVEELIQDRVDVEIPGARELMEKNESKECKHKCECEGKGDIHVT